MLQSFHLNQTGFSDSGTSRWRESWEGYSGTSFWHRWCTRGSNRVSGDGTNY